MSLGYEPLLIDFFRMAEVKPSFCPVCTSASKIADATEIDAITVSAQAVQRTMDRGLSSKDDWRARLEPATWDDANLC